MIALGEFRNRFFRNGAKRYKGREEMVCLYAYQQNKSEKVYWYNMSRAKK